MKFLLVIVCTVMYFLVGAGVFISMSSRTAQRCPGEDQARSIVYGVAWPMLLGYRILDGDMQKIPNCRVKFPDEPKEDSNAVSKSS